MSALPDVTGIHFPAGRRYADVMADITSNTVIAEPSRFSNRLPRPLWIGLAAALAIVASIGLRVGVPLYRQHVAIQQIQRIGGSVVLRHAVPPGVQSVIGRLGMDPLVEIWEVDFAGTNITDADLPLLHGLQMESVCLSDTRVSNAGLTHLKPLTHLRQLNLDRTSVTASGMDRLADLNGLTRLSLIGTDVSNAGLYDLRNLGTLQHLNLSDTLVTNSGLRHHLAKMHNLKSVCLRGTKVTDAGVAELQRAVPGLTIIK